MKAIAFVFCLFGSNLTFAYSDDAITSAENILKAVLAQSQSPAKPTKILQAQKHLWDMRYLSGHIATDVYCAYVVKVQEDLKTQLNASGTAAPSDFSIYLKEEAELQRLIHLCR